MADAKTVKQCKSCPWKVGCVPERDIPNGYTREAHKRLKATIRSGIESLRGGLQIMACHHSKPGEEVPCAGWLANQLGVGNNLGLRLSVMHGRTPIPETEGPQHMTFAATLRRRARR